MKTTNIKKYKELFESIDSEYVKNILKKSGVENPILHHKDLDELSEYFTNEFQSIKLPFHKKYEIFGVLFGGTFIDIGIPEDYYKAQSINY